MDLIPHLLLDRFMLHSDDGLSLLSDTGSTTFTGSLVLDTASLSLVIDDFGTGLLSLGFMDIFHEHTLVLENVTLGLLIQDVVQVLVDLPCLSVFPEQSPQDSLPPHPKNLARHTSFGRSLSFTGTGVATFSLGGKEVACACSRMNGSGLNNDTAVFDELLDMCAGVGVPDLGLLSWVEPNFAFTDARDAGGEAFLRS